MKNLFFTVLFSTFLSICLYSQTGTIKIVKPKKIEPSDNKPLERLPIYCGSTFDKSEKFIFGIGSNYSFKKNNKVGYEFELIRPGHIIITGKYRLYPYVGLRYSFEQIYFRLSPYDPIIDQSTIGIAKSQNKMQYIKIPLGLSSHLPIGPWRLDFNAELIPKFLIDNKNIRLSENDFKKFNLSGSVGLDLCFNKNYSVRFAYSKDFYENLKDKNIYNITGEVAGNQKTKTDLISFTLRYWLY